MLVSSLVLCATVKSAVQRRRLVPPRRRLALRLASMPWFFMLPMFCVTKFVKLVPAGGGDTKVKAGDFLFFHEIEPLKRRAEKAQSVATAYEAGGNPSISQ